MTSYLITGSIATVAGATHFYQYALLWLMVGFPFYTVILEENLSGFFYLPIINGVSEGSVVTSMALHFIAYNGNDKFKEDIKLFSFNSKDYIVKIADVVIFCFFCIGFFFFLIK